MERRGVRQVLRWCLVPLAVAMGPWSGGVFAQSGSDMVVTGILIGPTPVAIIRAEGHTFITKVGEPVGDATVVAILPTKVVLKRGHATFELPAPSAARPRSGATPSGSGAASTRTVPSKAAAPSAVRKRSAPVTPTPAAAPASPGAGMTVTGILEGKRRVAIVQAGGQSYVAGAGDSVGDALVVSILPHKVVLKRNGTVFELPITGTVAGKTAS